MTGLILTLNNQINNRKPDKYISLKYMYNLFYIKVQSLVMYKLFQTFLYKYTTIQHNKLQKSVKQFLICNLSIVTSDMSSIKYKLRKNNHAR